MVATDDAGLWRRMWSYKDHGKSWEAVYERDHPPGFRWLHESFGSNYRGTEMQAAIGRIQYRKLPMWHKQRTENALYLAELLDAIPGLRVPRPTADETHAYYRLYARLDLGLLRTGWDRDRLIGTMGAQGHSLSIGSTTEAYREKAFEHLDTGLRESLPGAAQRGIDALALPVHPGLKTEELVALSEALAATLCRIGSQ